MAAYKVGLVGAGDAEDGKSTVTLNSLTGTWIATNDSAPNLLKSLKGSYVSGTNVVPGFKTKGTGLIIEGKDAKNKDSVESFLYNYIPSENVKTGQARMVQTGSAGNWERIGT